MHCFGIRLRPHLCILLATVFAAPSLATNHHHHHHHNGPQHQLPSIAQHRRSGIELNSTGVPLPLRYLIHSFETLQARFFSDESGDYPAAIDWTAAVIQTHAVSSLHSILLSQLPKNETLNLIDIYFPDIASFYDTQNVGSLRFQAFDDMLWVVLGWLAAVRFLDAYHNLYPEDYNQDFYSHRKDFALRAREFYFYAERGWDELFCGGGCIWNPNLNPYKNAITNELFISASAQMYTTFPPEYNPDYESSAGDPEDGRDISFLQNAAKGYAWLKATNFTNDAGLIIDGFHISSYWKRKCDERDEQTYTYNQGVVLSGLRALWEITGKEEYLHDGYELINSVIKSGGKFGEMVRKEILEEHCDIFGWCNQDAQAFKGIFFHHFTAFCSVHAYTGTWKPAEEKPVPGLDAHLERCKTFFPFVTKNAEAAWSTRDSYRSVFGMWWSAPLYENDPRFKSKLRDGSLDLMRDPEAVDFINTVRGEDWMLSATMAELRLGESGKVDWEKGNLADSLDSMVHTNGHGGAGGDLNDRFRGRTVETQTGGVGVIRAALEIGILFEE
ncbi:hypothetical protein H072_1599 [Dactylellina haptotyla CBS 200.50]|uniref:Uncharacterized protein n=1 Tax=Dactylellina haptotyla (strain CBS 200.50) TaxID=1284197 RepID=S8ANA1_DACHA|nr:hypothetical protein H072_1599 [Dactylellina haptotyla CBS 200.50]